MSVNYTLLRIHLYTVHKNEAAHHLGDGEALNQHHAEHHGPGGLRNHLHVDAIPPTEWTTDTLLLDPGSGVAAATVLAGHDPRKPDPWMTIVEVAEELRTSKMTVHRLIHRGQIRHTKVGRGFRIRRSWLNQYVDNHTEGPES